MKERRFRTIYANFVIAAVLIVSFGIAVVFTAPTGDQSEAVNNTAIYEGDKNCQSVALMFNVYERTDLVEQIADIFDEYGYKTTFFVGGSWAGKNHDTLTRLASGGFEIGNHGYMHRDHAKLSLKQNKDEITVTEKLIDGTLSALPDYKNCKLFAPPSGSMGKNMFEACKELGYRVIMWTRDTIDWRDHDENLIFERATKGLKAGDLILMHPTDCTVAALPKILDCIKAQGLKADIVSNVIENTGETE